ncbi:UNVERIFIED_CONTAM: hypothetical protein Sangu_1451300 [Sesamum angustifolium]|uniref:Uncharacterized protein n=1 Tax=Sesamum angustifolium TaxID=2727405 RepID=A0AAW2N6Y1_9LAMI
MPRPMLPTSPRLAKTSTEPAGHGVSLDTPPTELSSILLGAIRQMITSTIHEQLTVLIHVRTMTPSEMPTPEQINPALVSTLAPAQVGDVPPQWLARLNHLQKELQDVQYQMMGAPSKEQADIPFRERLMTGELPMCCRTPAITEYDGTTNPQEHLSHFENEALLHRYTNGIKCRVFFHYLCPGSTTMV